MEREMENERIRREQVLTGNPLLQAKIKPDFVVRRR